MFTDCLILVSSGRLVKFASIFGTPGETLDCFTALSCPLETGVATTREGHFANVGRCGARYTRRHLKPPGVDLESLNLECQVPRGFHRGNTSSRWEFGGLLFIAEVNNGRVHDSMMDIRWPNRMADDVAEMIHHTGEV